MTSDIAAETAVGRRFEPIFTWPLLDQEQWDSLVKPVLPVLPDSLRNIGGMVIDCVQAPEKNRSMIRIPHGVITCKDELLAVTQSVANQLDRRQLRYGRFGENLLIGFSTELSEVEASICDEYMLKPGIVATGSKASSETAANSDGSITYTCRALVFGPRRVARVQAMVTEELAPRLSSMVACNALVLLTDRSVSDSLFMSQKDPAG